MTPSGVPANLFSYHLDGLITAKLIEKSARGTYTLTAKGQKFAGKFSTATNRQTEEIKTVIILYANQGDKHLLFRWSRQPYLGKVTPLYDRVPFGKSLQDGINSALDDKLGKRVPTKFRTSALIKITTGNETVSHMNVLIYEIETSEIPENHESRNGQAILLSANDPDVMAGVADFLNTLDHASEPFEATWHY